MFNQFYPGFMPNYGPTVTPYNTQPQTPPRMNTVSDQPAISTINTIQKTNPTVSCYFVNDKSEMQSLDTIPGTVYIGLNKTNKEIYLRSWNTDGKIDFDVYSQVETGQETTEMQAIMNKLNAIEEKINERNVYKANDGTVNARKFSKSSNVSNVSTNDAGENTATKASDIS